MAMGDPYATKAELKKYLDIPADVVEDDSQLDDALNSASREIDAHTGRQFNKDTVATPRLFEPDSCRSVAVDDFWTTAGLVIKTRSGDSFGEAWGASDYELLPLNGVMDGQPGWPYSRIHAVGSYFSVGKYARHRSQVEVTAQWGWAAVPAPVKQATLMLAAQNFKISEAPFGVAGFDQYGVVRVRDIPLLERKLCRYVVQPILVG
jgi:hypothetical protein